MFCVVKHDAAICPDRQDTLPDNKDQWRIEDALAASGQRDEGTAVTTTNHTSTRMLSAP